MTDNEVTITAARYKKYQESEIILEAIAAVLEARGYVGMCNAEGISQIIDEAASTKSHNEHLEHQLAYDHEVLQEMTDEELEQFVLNARKLRNAEKS